MPRHRLEQQVTQSPELRLSPSMQVSLRMLELPNLDLSPYLEELLLGNPVVELTFPEPSADNRGFLHESSRTADGEYAPELVDPLEDTLYTRLSEEICWNQPPGHLRDDVLYLVGNLSPTGYLETSLAELQNLSGCSGDHWKWALAQIQEMDPAGVGARSLQECLYLQAAREFGREHLLTSMVSQYWDDVRHLSLDRLARRLKISPDQVITLFKQLSTLNPIPGASIGTNQPASLLYPDLVARRDRHGTVGIEPVREYLPRVRLIPEYLTMKQKSSDRTIRSFLTQSVTEVRCVERALKLRLETLVTVASFMASRQIGFLFNQLPLEPLTVREVAHAVGLHESTVRRAIAGKMLQTPASVIPLKCLLCESLAESRHISIDHAKRLIAALIADESPHYPHSDSQIAHRLQHQGLPIARRTVAKYRQELGYPSRELRRQAYLIHDHPKGEHRHGS